MAPNSNIFRNFRRAIESLLKKVTTFAKCGNRGILLVWDDPTGLRHWGTENLVIKFESTRNCENCCNQTSWESSAKSDSIGLRLYLK
jgi:hypothetical protein